MHRVISYLNIWSVVLLVLLVGGYSWPVASYEAPSVESTSKLYIGETLHPSKFTRSYSLTEDVENGRKVFRLFYQDKGALQDLAWEKSFPISSDELTRAWLQKVLVQYSLRMVSHFSTMYEIVPDVSMAIQNRPAPAKIWTTYNEWNENWESKFGEWVSRNFNSRFMVDLKLPTDCADVAYSLRWIFARVNGLPMANRLGGRGVLFTNESMRKEWLALPTDTDWKKDQRFMAALKYLIRNTYTHTLMRDSYPVAITEKYLTPGTFHISLHGSSGHTMVVDKVNEPNALPVSLLYSTTPVRIRDLWETFYQEESDPIPNESGFYKIRWSKKVGGIWQLLPAKLIPGYSQEQFDLPSSEGQSKREPHFIRVYRKLQPNFQFSLMLEKSYEEIQARIQDRIDLVKEGYDYCVQHDCAPGSVGEEDWSTPSRDSRLMGLHHSMNRAAELMKQYESESTVKRIKERLKSEEQRKRITIDGVEYSLGNILMALTHKLTRTDPRLPVSRRWGLTVKGYSENLIEAMNSTIEVRKGLVAAAKDCTQNYCPEDSAEFKKQQTIELDRELALQWSGASKLCKLYENGELPAGDACTFLNNQLQAQSKDGRTLLDWIERIPLWMGDPNVPTDLRWGSKGTIYKKTDATPSFAIESGDWYTLNGKLWNIGSLEPQELQQGETLGQLHRRSNIYFTYERLDERLVLRVRQVPNNLLGEVVLPVRSSEPLRVWWSGEQSESLVVFSSRHFYILNRFGKLTSDGQYERILGLQNDPQLTFIKDRSGWKISDATSDASLLVPIPLSEEEVLSIQSVQRTKLGWGFKLRGMENSTQSNRFIYVEENTRLFEWTGSNDVIISLANDARWIVLGQFSETKVVVFKRLNEPTSVGAFQKHREFKSDYFNLFDAHIVVFQDGIPNIYSLPDFEPSTLACSDQSMFSFVFSNKFYLCQTPDFGEIRTIDSKVIHTDKAGDRFWYSEVQGKDDWLSNTFSEVPIRNLYFYKKNQLWGPLFQISDEFYENGASHQGTQDFPMPRHQIAPVNIPMNQKTNFGYVIPYPQAKSFYLDLVCPERAPLEVLFLPDLKI